MLYSQSRGNRGHSRAKCGVALFWASNLTTFLTDMKKSLPIILTAAALIITAHRLPAPVTEIPETPTPAPAVTPKPTPAESAEEKPKAKKPKPENESAPKRAAAESNRVSITGTWRGHWDNNRGEQGMATMSFNDGPNGAITGFGDSIPFSPKPPIENGHRSGNSMTFTFHRMGRDYHVTMTVSPDGSTINGEYKVVQNQKLIYTGKYTDFKRK